MTIRATILAGAAVLALALPASPQGAERHLLHEGGAWRTELEVYPSGNMACAANSLNANRDQIDVTAWPDGSVSLFMFFAEAIPREFSADIEVRIDRGYWTLMDANFYGGPGVETKIAFTFEDTAGAWEFISDLRTGRVVALRDDAATGDYAAWSLTGSNAAIAAMFECAERIKGEPA